MMMVLKGDDERKYLSLRKSYLSAELLNINLRLKELDEVKND